MDKPKHVLVSAAYSDVATVLLRHKAQGLTPAELAEAIIRAMSEANIPRHELGTAYDRLDM